MSQTNYYVFKNAQWTNFYGAFITPYANARYTRIDNVVNSELKTL